MTLRRFPWKLPRTSDVSYKYFVAEPTPGAPTVASLKRGNSNSNSNEKSTQNGQPASSSTGAEATSQGSTTTGQAQQSSQSLRGPWRLLRLLPRESRYIIGRMLEVSPRKRATLDEVHADEWISTRPYCQQELDGTILRAEGHTHVLEPGSGE